MIGIVMGIGSATLAWAKGALVAGIDNLRKDRGQVMERGIGSGSVSITSTSTSTTTIAFDTTLFLATV